MKPHEFRMIETLSPEALEEHPVWAPFRPDDRARVLAWGVAPERLDAELERYGYCGLEPLYPVLEPEGLHDPTDHFVAVTAWLACGVELPGYLLEPQAFGVFVAERDFTFNRGLEDFSQRTAGRLAEALGVDAGSVFPLRYRSRVRRAGAARWEGSIDAPW